LIYKVVVEGREENSRRVWLLALVEEGRVLPSLEEGGYARKGPGGKPTGTFELEMLKGTLSVPAQIDLATARPIPLGRSANVWCSRMAGR